MAHTGSRASAGLVVAAAVCFGTTGTAQALGGAGASALSLGAARIVFGGGLLALIALVTVLRARAGAASGGGRGSRVPAVAGHPPRRMVAVGLVVVGALGVAAYQPTFFTGTSQNGVAVGTLVALGSAPVLTGLLEWLVFRRAPGRRWALATGVAALGVAALSGVFADVVSGAASTGSVTPLGLLASLGAGLSYAVYASSSKALLDRGWPPALVMGATFGAAAAIMLPVLLTTDLTWLATPSGAVTVGWLAIVTTALAYTLFARGLQALPASCAATLTLVEPLTATVLGVVVLHEQFTVSTVAGLVLLVAGLAILTVGGRGRAVQVGAVPARVGARPGDAEIPSIGSAADGRRQGRAPDARGAAVEITPVAGEAP